MKRCIVTVLALLLVPAALFCQEFRGTLTGSVTDATGAVVAGAKITITAVQTNTKVETVSEPSGHYTAPFLLPGDYEISVKLQGFKEFVRKGVHLGAGDHVAVDVRLDVGDATQSVEVTADAPMVNAESASVGQAVTTKEVDELPLNGRTPMVLASLSLGVLPTGQPSLIHPFDSGAGNAWNVGGTPAQTSEIMVDGVPNATWDGRLAYSLPQDAVQEVRVKAFDSDASFGHTGGGTLNQVMKTGTNQLHGTLWEYNQPNTLTANDFFNNAKGVARPLSHLNQYGVTAGGPIWIPKVVNGKNKMFWFFAWEGMKDGQPAPTLLTVPTDLEKQGNFSQVLAADGSSAQLYDPFNATQTGSTINRTPYPGNIIPRNLLSPIALAYLPYYGTPNIVPTRPDGFQNFGSNAVTTDNYNNEMGRFDYNMSDRSRLAFNVRHTDYSQLKNNYFNNVAEGSLLFRNNWGATVDEVYTINPTNVLDMRFNYTRMAESHAAPSAGFDPGSLGFPSYLGGNSTYLQMPIIAFNSNSGFQQLGSSSSGSDRIPSQSFQLFASWVRIVGNHTLKFGTDDRQYRLNTFTAGASTGQFTFGNNWVKASSSASSTVVIGQDFASFLLGLPTTSSSSTYDVNTFGSWYSYYASGFIQDDWRVKHNLTVNLGLRYEKDLPYNEVWGRSVNGFDTTSSSPLAAAAQAAYARSPIAQLAASQFQVLGGLMFASPSNTQVFRNTSNLFSPRGSLAWSPDRFHGKTVIRAGVGMFESPVGVSYVGPDGKYSTSPRTPLGQEGFSQSTPITATNNNYLTPYGTLSNPFPVGLLQPAGSSGGLGTYLGQAVQFLNPEMQNGYSVRWQFDIQQTLTPNTMLEVAYIGNHALHLPVNVTQLNGIPRQYESTYAARDGSTNYLTSSVANPFAGLPTSQNGSTTTPAQLLARFPQFPVGDSAGGWSGSGGVLEFNNDIGSSYFQSLNVRLQKRTAHGLTLTTNFIYSKMIERLSWLNDSDPTLERRVSPNDRPLRFVISGVYELPVGPGRLVNLHGISNTVFGGWKLTSIYSYQLGAPINWVNGSSSSPGDYVYFGGPLDLNNRQVNGTAFNKAVFDTLAADQFQYHIRTFSTTFGNLRADGINQLDSSILKTFQFGETQRYVQLRGEMFNVPNHPVFAAPNTTATNSAFGTITSTVNRFRTVQVSARVVF